MTDKPVLFGRTQTNTDINGDKSIIKIVNSHGNETIGMLDKTQRDSTVQRCRDAGKCVAQKQGIKILTLSQCKSNQFRYIWGKLCHKTYCFPLLILQMKQRNVVLV